MSKKIISILASFLIAISVFSGCGGKKISTAQDVYYIEYGSAFTVPEATFEGSTKDISYEVKDSKGRVITVSDTLIPKIGEYTITYFSDTVKNAQHTVKVICQDTTEPELKIKYLTSYVSVGDECKYAYEFSDISSLNKASQKITVVDSSGKSVTPFNNIFTAENVQYYTLTFEAEDIYKNKCSKNVVINVGEKFTDTQIDSATAFDFDEAEYINLVGSCYNQNMPSASIISDGYPTKVASGVSAPSSGVLKLASKQGATSYECRLIHGNAIDLNNIKRMYIKIAFSAIPEYFGIFNAFKDVNGDVDVKSLSANTWYCLEVPTAVWAGGNGTKDFIINFKAENDVSIFIDEIYSVSPRDNDWSDTLFADFDEELYNELVYTNSNVSANVINRSNATDAEKAIMAGKGDGILKVNIADVTAHTDNEAYHVGYDFPVDKMLNKYSYATSDSLILTFEAYIPPEIIEGIDMRVSFFMRAGRDGVSSQMVYDNTGSINGYLAQTAKIHSGWNTIQIFASTMEICMGGNLKELTDIQSINFLFFKKANAENFPNDVTVYLNDITRESNFTFDDNSHLSAISSTNSTYELVDSGAEAIQGKALKITPTDKKISTIVMSLDSELDSAKLAFYSYRICFPGATITDIEMKIKLEDNEGNNQELNVWRHYLADNWTVKTSFMVNMNPVGGDISNIPAKISKITITVISKSELKPYYMDSFNFISCVK